MKKIISILLISLVWMMTAGAATVDTIAIYSAAMKKETKCVVILPDDYHSSMEKNKNIRYPVVYLLHGYSGNYSSWISGAPEIKKLADVNRVIIVCPDGGFGSWYLDSPLDSSFRYETFVGKEVPEYIDTHYNTIDNRKARAITGLSMGGHGGLYIGFRHAGTFGACGSMSGGVDIRPFPERWDIRKRIGDQSTHRENWDKYSVINVIDNYRSDSTRIIIDCGVDDFFYEVNKALHEKMLKLKIGHDYIERPGAHDWVYWVNAVKYQLLFFRNYFGQQGYR